MKSLRPALTALAILVPCLALAGERIAGTNTYMVNEKQFPTDRGMFWILDNYGTFEVSEGPIEPGPVQCHGSGYWKDLTGSDGAGICVYGAGADTFTMAWTARPGQTTTWEIVQASGRYEGMTGSGKSATRTESEQRIMPVRISDWSGEIELPR